MNHTIPHSAFRIPHSTSSRGFTLIELLATSVLTVILMSAVLTVLKSSFDETRQLRAEQSRHPSIGLLEEQIRRDVQNARGMQAGTNSLQLYGYLATDASTRMPTLERAVVTYQVRALPHHAVLVREEQPVGDLVPGPPRREAVWEGVRRLDVTAFGSVDLEEGDVANGPPPDTGGLSPMPRALRIVLVDDSQRVLLRETIRHHQEL